MSAAGSSHLENNDFPSVGGNTAVSFSLSPVPLARCSVKKRAGGRGCLWKNPGYPLKGAIEPVSRGKGVLNNRTGVNCASWQYSDESCTVPSIPAKMTSLYCEQASPCSLIRAR